MDEGVAVRRLRARPPATPDWLTSRYDQLARGWTARIARLGFVRAYRLVFQRIARMIGPELGARIAELGIGAGDASVALVRALQSEWSVDPRSLSVTGIDSSAAMLERASGALETLNVNRTLVRGDLRATGWSAAAFDVVIAAHSIEHLPDPGHGLAEVDRLLRPGGTAILIMTRCTVPTIVLEAQWSIVCVRSQLLAADLGGRGYPRVRLLRFPRGVIPNLMSFVCVARKPDV